MLPLAHPTRLYDAYIFDLDGTVYLGDALLPGARQAITTIRAAGKRTVFVSNNPVRSRAAYAAKLDGLGLPTPVTDILNSSAVMIDLLLRTMPTAQVLVCGEAALSDEMRAAGIALTENPRETDVVIASFDRTFEYRKLQLAFDAIRSGARFFATNADRYCPVPGGGEPDAAAIIAAIEACTDTRVELVAGKPSRHMADAVLDLVCLTADRCLLTGDRLETDIQMGLNVGMATALTLTGATTRAMSEQSAIQPTYLIESLLDLVSPLTRNT
ncbi:MAG: HAD-IIA family hydrolase [Anaerolineae bacterium]|nr:HAD-IIA family hydrolase [Anaerolineae bacterium]